MNPLCMGSFYTYLESGSISVEHLDLIIVNFVPKIGYICVTIYSNAITPCIDNSLKQLFGT